MGIEDKGENMTNEEKEERQKRADLGRQLDFIMEDIKSFRDYDEEKCSIEELEEIVNKFEELKNSL